MDTLIDVIAVKTGLILSPSNIEDLLGKEMPEVRDWIQNPDWDIRVRSEKLDEIVNSLRFKLGNTIDDKPGAAASVNIMMPWFFKEYDLENIEQKVWETFNSQPEIIHKKEVAIKLIQKIFIRDNLPQELIEDLFESYRLMRVRNNSVSASERINYQGTPLDDLFQSELTDAPEGAFISQKFLNFLAVNPEKLQKMLWRNFETFCSEYFLRIGYKVEIGPGRNDGGVDIMLYDADKSPEKPVIIVQCKRYHQGRDVSIEAVKAFSTDVQFAGAEKGIIATTSRIAPGGKLVTRERKFSLEFAEAGTIEGWALKMHTPLK